MKLIYNLTLIFFLFVCSVNAQEIGVSKQTSIDPTVKSLKVGEKVPDLLMAKLINYPTKKAKVSDFKDQLLILDFWDTYCSNCIEALPMLANLQQIFGNKIRIMPVTYQSEAIISDFFKKNAYAKNVKLPVVVEDKLLHAHFKHRLISHEVWIYKGVVKAITGMEYVTTANIQKILNGEPINWPVKDDEFSFDPKKPLFTLGNAAKYSTKSNFNGYSGMVGYRKGIDYRGGIAYDSVMHRTFFYNFSIVEAYKALLTGINRKKFLVGPSRIVVEVESPEDYLYNPEKGFREEWNDKNQFCYEMTTAQPLEKKERLQLIVNDLNNRLGLNGRFEKRTTKCLVLVQREHAPSDSLSMKTGAEYTEYSNLDNLAFALDYTQRYPPAINEANYKGKIKIIPTRDLTDLRKQLEPYGIDIIEAERNIEMLVITETKTAPNLIK